MSDHFRNVTNVPATALSNFFSCLYEIDEITWKTYSTRWQISLFTVFNCARQASSNNSLVICCSVTLVSCSVPCKKISISYYVVSVPLCLSVTAQYISRDRIKESDSHVFSGRILPMCINRCVCLERVRYQCTFCISTFYSLTFTSSSHHSWDTFLARTCWLHQQIDEKDYILFSSKSFLLQFCFVVSDVFTISGSSRHSLHFSDFSSFRSWFGLVTRMPSLQKYSPEISIGDSLTRPLLNMSQQVVSKKHRKVQQRLTIAW